MKSKKHIFLPFAFFIVIIGSCKDLELDESQYHTKKYQFSDFKQVKEVMTNVYGYMRPGFYNFQECASDDAVYANSPDKVKMYYDGSWSANNLVDDVWGYYYSAIRASNYLMENCPEDFEIARWHEQYPIFLEQLKNYPWEAKALRAYFHMELLKRYNRIIIADRTYNKEEVNGLKPARYEAAVDWIANELKEAAEKLPDTYSGTYFSEVGRVTKGFALSARIRLLLYAASPLSNISGEPEKYLKAAAAAKDFFTYNNSTSRYILTRQKFNTEGKEMIFGIRESANNYYETLNFPIGYENGNSGTCPSLNLVESFDMSDGRPFDFDTEKLSLLDATKRDPRLAIAVLSNGDSFKGDTIETFVGGKNGSPRDNASPTAFYLRKFIQEATSLTAGKVTSYQHIYPLFRLSEVYLNYAEALFEATKNPDFTGEIGGVEYTMSPCGAINAIRKIYLMPDLPVGMEETDFRDRLRKERRVELCFEGHRFWDLRRWKIGDKAISIYGLNILKTEEGVYSLEKKLVQKRYWDDKMYHYPIPETELRKNNNLLQNEGWK